MVVFYFSEQVIGKEHHVWKALRPAVFHGNEIYFITNAILEPPADLKGKFERIASRTLRNPLLTQFMSIYNKWGQREPWESLNFRRFFYLREFMRRRGLEWVFFADSDVAVLAPLKKSTLMTPGCEAYIDMRLSDMKSTKRVILFQSYYWAFWAGSSIMSFNVLSDWVHFTLQMYGSKDPDYVSNVLLKKKEARPFVCDMSLWYLYSVAADDSVALWVKAGENRDLLPETPKRHLCASNTLGFDHAQAYKDDAFELNRTAYTATLRHKPLLSIHFQGFKGTAALRSRSPSKSFFTKALKV